VNLPILNSILIWPTVLVGFLAACYTAFLFGQCEGRDLWQTPLLPVHLIVQALLCGAAVLSFLPGQLGAAPGIAAFSLLIAQSLHLLMLLGEVARSVLHSGSAPLAWAESCP
jgi:hypothetical protein